MVAGKKDLIYLPGVKRIDNDDYATTGELASLAAALESAAGETLVAFGDIQFRGDGAGQMLHDRADAAIAVDTWFREWAAGGRASDFVRLQQAPGGRGTIATTKRRRSRTRSWGRRGTRFTGRGSGCGNASRGASSWRGIFGRPGAPTARWRRGRAAIGRTASPER